MKLQTWSCVVCALVSSTAPALAFQGRVVDALGQPQAGAVVHVLGRSGEVFTDADGRFEWKPDPAPPFEVLVVLRGGTYTRPVRIEELGEDVVEVTIQAAVSDAMVVSGSAVGIESTPAAGTTTLSAAEIAVRQPSNLVQALENVAGVSQVSEGQAGVPAVRGLFAGRTLLLIDGARVTSERRVGPSATFLDPATVESIDVSRGPGSVAYGSDALGGVISVRTRGVEPGSPWKVRATGMLGGGGRPEHRESLRVSKGIEEGGFLISGHRREADDWESPEGPVFNSGYEDYGVLLRAENRVGPGILRATVQSDFASDVERPRDNSTSVRFYYPDEDSRRFTVNYDVNGVAGFSRIAFNGFVGSYGQTTDQDSFATATSGRSIERAVVAADDYHLRGFVERLFGSGRLEAGLDLNGRYDLHALEGRIAYDLSGQRIQDDTSVAVDDADRTDTGVYVSLDVAAADRLSLAAGLRGDRVETESSGGFFGDRSTSHDALSGYFAVTAGSFGGFSATAQVARGFRDPTLSDRYFRGPTGRGFITGNPDLDPETSLQYDLALRYTAGRFRIAAFYYRYDIEDLIERFETDPDFFRFRNRGEARVEGVEVEAQGELGGGFTLELAAQSSKGETLDDGARLDGIAPFTVSAQLRRQLGSRGFAQLRAAYYADDDEPGPTEIEAPGYTIIDLTGGWKLGRSLDLRALLRNLLDEEYFASEARRTVLAPGRSFAVVATVEF